MMKGYRKHIGISKKCLQCKGIIQRVERRRHSPSQWEELKYCGNLCANEARKGTIALWMKGDLNISKRLDVRDKISKALTGVRLSESHKERLKAGWIKRKKSGLGVHNSETREKMRKSAKKGCESISWRGGLTPLYLQIRHDWRSNQWREGVFKRDNYQCVTGGKKHGSKLNADHIKPFSVIVLENKITSLEMAIKCKELWDIKNGRTLCVPCHKETDTFGGRLNIKKSNKITV